MLMRPRLVSSHSRTHSLAVVARTEKPDISLADVKQGPKIGSGNFGDVYEGLVKGQRVILKGKKNANSVRTLTMLLYTCLTSI